MATPAYHLGQRRASTTPSATTASMNHPNGLRPQSRMVTMGGGETVEVCGDEDREGLSRVATYGIGDDGHGPEVTHGE